MSISTNRQYLTAALSRFNVSTSDIDLILAENTALNGDGTLNVTACKRAIHKSLSSLLPLANVSESQYSVSWNMEAIKIYYKSLCQELSLPNKLRPALRDRSNYW